LKAHALLNTQWRSRLATRDIREHLHDGSSDELERYERRLARVTIGTPPRLSGPIELSGYDTAWAQAYAHEAARIRDALRERALRVEHVGSTSVPGLPSKPIIDIVLEVSDSSAETAYCPDLDAAGYVLRIREPDWFEHRLFEGQLGAVNLHVFSSLCPETERMVRFRDWLRSNPADRDRYANAKRELASRRWTYVQQYADAKSAAIGSIMTRARGTR
jgi:GrpB-like predicted nucleotidyltransferase (UPF0157 family)